MTRVLCPRDGCPGILQAPFKIPGTNRTQPPYCPECRGKFPDLSGSFTPLSSDSGGGRQLKPEESLRLERNRFFRDVLRFAVYDLEQGHRPDGSRQTRGLPDTLLFGHGLQVWIEYKDTGRKQTSFQVEFQKHVERNGGLYYVIWPETPIKDILEEWEDHPDWRDSP